MTQTEAAKLIYCTLSAWVRWETDKASSDHRAMHPAFWELWKLKAKKAK